MARLTEKKIGITRLYYCPYHPVFGVGKYKHDSPDRKPNPGMLLRAQSDLDLDLGSSILIGDKLSDIQAGCAAGIGTQIFLTSKRFKCEPQTISCYVSSSLDDIRSTLFSRLGNIPSNGTKLNSASTLCRSQSLVIKSTAPLVVKPKEVS